MTKRIGEERRGEMRDKRERSDLRERRKSGVIQER